MEKNYNFKFNLEEPDGDAIRKHMDFDALLHQFEEQKAPQQRQARVRRLVYIATADNAAFLGESDEKAIAEHIARSHGPSGSNRDYLLQLADALRQLEASDEHVFAIEKYLRETIQ